MNPRQLYEDFIHGNSIEDNDLLEGIRFFKKLANDLCKCGPVFKLAFKETNSVYIRLHEFAVARNLKKPGEL
ncbi:MAG: hypothetical protein EO766_12175 [Hydrotalea sp. AMD]|uniref:hypothetical protein n=1 Tax=Hydrotalea sp. AMD TaxID=2501297 RepID=UPI0010259BF9|nr:hypothetical protein [Hydrotalea sp. AMD]RWZ87274.1 MAG: hypothetical protein EO766_12175 [Hydrotalea sp. AMD]